MLNVWAITNYRVTAVSEDFVNSSDWESQVYSIGNDLGSEQLLSDLLVYAVLLITAVLFRTMHSSSHK